MLIHHVVCYVAAEACDHEHAVTKGSTEAGIELARWFAYEAGRIYMMLAEGDEDRDLRRLLDFVQRRGGKASVRGLQKHNTKKYPRSEDAEAALGRLVEAGLARWVEPPATPKGGNVGRAVELVPQTSDSSDSWSDAPSDTAPGMDHDSILRGAVIPGRHGESASCHEVQVSEVSEVSDV